MYDVLVLDVTISGHGCRACNCIEVRLSPPTTFTRSGRGMCCLRAAQIPCRRVGRQSETINCQPSSTMCCTRTDLEGAVSCGVEKLLDLKLYCYCTMSCLTEMKRPTIIVSKPKEKKRNKKAEKREGKEVRWRKIKRKKKGKGEKKRKKGKWRRGAPPTTCIEMGMRMKQPPRPGKNFINNEYITR